jgi:hypothetical protein
VAILPFIPIKARGELLEPTDQVNLTVQFQDQFGNPVNTDMLPTISIIQPSGLVLLSPTTVGITNVGVGQYSYIWQIPINGPFGVYNDMWVGIINGFKVEATFNFVVAHSDQPSINDDGYIHLGDDPGFNYSQAAIFNINKVIKMMKARLNSAGKAKSVDSNGNVIYVDCDIFSVDMLTTFVAMSLNKFNSTPYFTNFQFEDSDFFATFAEVIADGASIFAMASQALIERGREFQLTDNGINFNPPTVSELLNTEYNTTLQNYWEQLKYIKNSMRPGPRALGVFSMTNGVSPQVKRLRFLRERRII